MATRTDLGKKAAPPLNARFEIMVPAVLPGAIALAAERALMSPSEYARRALIDRLLADGVDLRTGQASQAA